MLHLTEAGSRLSKSKTEFASTSPLGLVVEKFVDSLNEIVIIRYGLWACFPLSNKGHECCLHDKIQLLHETAQVVHVVVM